MCLYAKKVISKAAFLIKFKLGIEKKIPCGFIFKLLSNLICSLCSDRILFVSFCFVKALPKKKVIYL